MRLSPRERDVVAWIASSEPEMQGLLATLVNIDSGTRNRVGVTTVSQSLQSFLAGRTIGSAALAGGAFGDGFRATVPGRSEARSILLMGHLDTVFPEGEAGRRPFAMEGDVAFGPGVADMKGGLVINAFVAAALQVAGGLSRPIVVQCTGDEEVGSPHYRSIIEREAAQAAYAFNAEPGRASGNVVTVRRGGTFMRLTVHGRAAHSGANLRDGISAIGELAHKIVELHALTDFDAGVTVNVGVVSGGQTVNTTAPRAEALIDLRFDSGSERTEAMRRISDIVSRSYVAGSSAELDITGDFVPLLPTPASADLLSLYRHAAWDLGFEVDGEATGGCADSGFAAASGATTLCGTGPVGGKAHTPNEYIKLPTLVTRAQALALTMLRLPDHDIERTSR